MLRGQIIWILLVWNFKRPLSDIATLQESQNHRNWIHKARKSQCFRNFQETPDHKIYIILGEPSKLKNRKICDNVPNRGEGFYENMPAFYSGSCNEIHARTKLQNKTSLKYFWNALETLWNFLETHMTFSSLKHLRNCLATPFEILLDTHQSFLKHH